MFATIIVSREGCRQRPAPVGPPPGALALIRFVRYLDGRNMSPFPVNPDKERQLQQRMRALGLTEADLQEWFIRGGGPGGQKTNKTSSTVCLRHRPTGLEVRCARERSQALNRFLARRELCDKFAARLRGEESKRQQEREKIRRQKRRRSRRQTARMVDDKKKHGAKKALRQRPGPED
ncbi:MAG TPA: peptide chain release factor-like protein [Kiritimatiellia bacterium]|nr:peptide chain release factor-like protein [Kiritimatiellia bacterium]